MRPIIQPLLFALMVLGTACSTTQQGVLKTPENAPLVISDGTRSATLSPGPMTAQVNFTFYKVYFEDTAKRQVPIPFVKGQANQDDLARFEKKRYSHYGNHQEVFIANIGEPYTTESEGVCYTAGTCQQEEKILNCGGQQYSEHYRPKEYNDHKNDKNCFTSTGTYSARSSTCEGRAITRTLKQDYSAFDSFDFFNLANNRAEGYFDSLTTTRTQELSSSTGTCWISQP